MRLHSCERETLAHCSESFGTFCICWSRKTEAGQPAFRRAKPQDWSSPPSPHALQAQSLPSLPSISGKFLSSLDWCTQESRRKRRTSLFCWSSFCSVQSQWAWRIHRSQEEYFQASGLCKWYWVHVGAQEPKCTGRRWFWQHPLRISFVCAGGRKALLLDKSQEWSCSGSLTQNRSACLLFLGVLFLQLPAAKSPFLQGLAGTFSSHPAGLSS